MLQVLCPPPGDAGDSARRAHYGAVSREGRLAVTGWGDDPPVTVASTGGCDGFVAFSNRIVSEETQQIRSKLIAKLLRPTGGWRTPE